MTTWITDDHGNRASVEYWGSKENAEASLKTLTNCRNCMNCANCRNCRNCTVCSYCANCTNCTDCSYCSYCRNCTNCMNCMNCTNCTDCSYCSYCRNCTNCRNCSYCRNCKNCTVCSYCRNCANCRNCRNCTVCRDCDLSKQNYRVPVSDHRRFTWLAISEKGEWRIRAGCRNFSIQEAREHWLSEDYNGPESIKETIGFALDWIESKPIERKECDDGKGNRD
jgi:hypothetical protein